MYCTLWRILNLHLKFTFCVLHLSKHVMLTPVSLTIKVYRFLICFIVFPLPTERSSNSTTYKGKVNIKVLLINSINFLWSSRKVKVNRWNRPVGTPSFVFDFMDNHWGFYTLLSFVNISLMDHVCKTQLVLNIY